MFTVYIPTLLLFKLNNSKLYLHFFKFLIHFTSYNPTVHCTYKQREKIFNDIKEIFYYTSINSNIRMFGNTYVLVKNYGDV